MWTDHLGRRDDRILKQLLHCGGSRRKTITQKMRFKSSLHMLLGKMKHLTDQWEHLGFWIGVHERNLFMITDRNWKILEEIMNR